MAADFYQRITEMQGGVEDLIRKVPGVKELLERSDLRAADDLLRQQLASQLEQQMTRFDSIKQQVMDAAGLEHMERVQTVDTKMRAFINRIEAAADGYAGVFGKVKVNSDALERVYAFDNALFLYVDQFATGLTALEAAANDSEGDIGSILRQLNDLATEANSVFSQRVEALQGIQNDAV